MKKRLWIIGIVIALAVGLMTGGSEGAVKSSDSIVSAIAVEEMTADSAKGGDATAHFNFAAGIATDGVNLYFVDNYIHIIRKVVISTGEVSTFAGFAGVIGDADGFGSGALFNHPQGITTDGTNLYVADSINCTIRKVVISTGEVSTFAGTAGACGSTDGAGFAAQFGAPHSITTDGINLYVTDSYNATIRKIVISTGVVTTLAGSTRIFGSTDGTGVAARFNCPASITMEGANLYVVDKGSNTIRQIVITTGEVTTLVGTAGVSGSTDGTGGAAQFGAPYGITTEGANLYVTDTYNGTVRKIVISTGAVTTLAGSAKKFGSTNGIGTAARFSLVTGITTDGINLYVVNTGSNSIRKIVIATGEVETLTGVARVPGHR